MPDQNLNDQIFPDGIDPSTFERVSPGHWEDPLSGTVFYTGTDWTPPPTGPTLTVTTITGSQTAGNQSNRNQSNGK